MMMKGTYRSAIGDCVVVCSRAQTDQLCSLAGNPQLLLDQLFTGCQIIPQYPCNQNY